MLQKAVQVLEVLRSSDQGLSIREIARRAGLSKSSVQRVLRDLVDTELATQDATTRQYQLGPRLFALAATYHHKLGVRQIALPHMTRLRDATGETVGLTIRTGDQIMHVEQAEAPTELRATFEIGRRLPLWSGAPSRLFLTEASDLEIRRILTERRPGDVTPIDPPDLATEQVSIETARATGYAVAFEETTKGVDTVSAPIRDATGAMVATLSVTWPSSRRATDADGPLTDRLVAVAERISTELGWVRPPTPRARPALSGPRTISPSAGRCPAARTGPTPAREG